MSRQNIETMIPDPRGGTVSFNCRNGEVRSYHYDIPDFVAILGGADPKDFIPDGEGGGGNALGDVLTDAGEVGEAALDIGEGIVDIGFITGF